jgi:DNA-binding MarR family transcriptional regulator
LILRVGWLEQRRLARDLAGFGLTVTQFSVLRSILHQDQQSTMSALADETLLRCATMTGIVDRLARMGLVARQRDPEDRRRVLVELTPSGREALQGVRRKRRARLQDTLVHLSSDDAEELVRLLKLYLEALGNQLERDRSG